MKALKSLVFKLFQFYDVHATVSEPEKLARKLSRLGRCPRAHEVRYAKSQSDRAPLDSRSSLNTLKSEPRMSFNRATYGNPTSIIFWSIFVSNSWNSNRYDDDNRNTGGGYNRKGRKNPEDRLYIYSVPTSPEKLRVCGTGVEGIGHNIGVPLHLNGFCFHRVIKDFMMQGGDIPVRNDIGEESIYGWEFEDENCPLTACNTLKFP